MGITYKVRIRCLRVDDKSKVNLNPIHYDDNKDREIWQEQLKKYYDELYPNVNKIVGMYNHDTCYKSYYLMANLLIPRWYDWKTCPQVMVISNFAYDRRGDTLYKTTFFDTLGDVISVEKRIIPCEENRFMLLIPEEAHSFNYLITSPFENVDNSSHECVHFYNHEKKCITCPKYVCHTEDDSDSDSTVTLGEHDQADAYDESEDEEPPTKRPNSTCVEKTCKLLIWIFQNNIRKILKFLKLIGMKSPRYYYATSNSWKKVFTKFKNY